MKVEVFIPYFNHEKYILDAVSSVKTPKNRNWEISIKIVNDGSDYNKLLRIIDTKQFNLNVQIYDSPNIGAFAQHLKAIKESKADILFFLNSDDTYHENRIEYFVNALKSYTHTWAYSDVNVINQNPYMINHEQYISGILAYQSEFKSTNRLFKDNSLITTGNLVLKNPVYYANVIPHFRFDNLHDWYMARNLAMIGNPVYIPLKLYNYRIHDSNTFSRNLSESQVESRLLHFVEQQAIALGYFGVTNDQRSKNGKEVK